MKRARRGRGELAAGRRRKLYGGLGLRPSVFFDRETFGADRLLPMPGYERYGEAGEAPEAPSDAWTSFLAARRCPSPAKRDLRRLYTEPADYLPGLTSDQKKSRLARMSYADFLTGPAGAHRDVLPFFQTRPHTLYGVGIDAVPAQDAWGLGLPGFDGHEPGRRSRSGHELRRHPPRGEPYFFHFPDGNATLARLMVRALIPRAIPGRNADDVVTARADYARLDEAASPARLRLNSTVVRVAHRGSRPMRRRWTSPTRGGAGSRSVRGARVVLACWNTVIPYLCPDLPADQKDALAYAVKVPIVYTNVLLRNWTSFARLGTNQVYAPGSYHTSLNLDLPVSVGEYTSPRGPDEPIVVHMVRTPCSPGLPARDAAPGRPHRAAVHDLRSLRAADPRPARPHAGRGRVRPRARHPRPSPSTAGRTATRTSTTRCGTRSGWRAARHRARSRGAASAASPSRTRTPPPTRTRTRPSTRRTAR